MGLGMMLLVAVGLWLAVLVLVLALCRAAKRGDEAIDTALADPIVTTRDTSAARPPSFERRLRALSLDHAAILLDVHPHTLLAWEAHYGFPKSSPSDRRYSRSEVLALRDGLEDGLSIASAVVRAKEQMKRERTRTAQSPPLVERRGGGLAS